MKATECLNVEHDVFETQLDRLDLAIKETKRYKPEAVQAMVELLRVAVDRHAHIEEGGLYKALEPHLGREQGPLAVMELEHEEIRKTVVEIAKWKPPQKGEVLRKNAERFSSILRGHIEKERNVLFPMADQVLGDEKLLKLAHECACAKQEEQAVQSPKIGKLTPSN